MHEPLKRLLGTPTAWLLGMSVAIGSGIFRTPGDVAAALPAPGWILLVWLAAGLIVLVQGLVTAELGTRFPRAGGEYVYLREAYGNFAAFFFGWAYTVFIIGGGAAAIALALGDFASDLSASMFGPGGRLAPGWIAAGAVVLVTAVNAAGLRTGAGFQNTLAALKVVALLVLVVCGLMWGSRPVDLTPTAPPQTHGSWWSMFLAALLPALWSYDGTTDSVKMSEEVRDVRHTVPRGIVGATLSLIVLYVLVNLALLRVLPAEEMAGQASVPGVALGRLFGEAGQRAVLIVAIVVCLGSLSSTLLATVRVTFALARDGLAPAFLGRMSAAQAPVGALLLVGGFSLGLVAGRGFGQVLDIYFLVSAILFGLAYGSLLIFRRRDAGAAEQVFRCPGGPLLAVLLILFQLALAADIAIRQWRTDRLALVWVVVILGVLGGAYLGWTRWSGRGRLSEHG